MRDTTPATNVENDNHPTAKDTPSAGVPTPQSEHRGVGARFIAGFAAFGLILAASIGIWTLQTSDDSATARENTTASQPTAETSNSVSQSMVNRPSESGRLRPPSPSGPSMGSSSLPDANTGANGAGTSTLTPLSEDPFLPPNTLGSRRSHSGAQASSHAVTSPAPSQSTPSPKQPQPVLPPLPVQPPRPIDQLPIPTDPADAFGVLVPKPVETGTEVRPTVQVTDEPPIPTAPTKPTTTSPTGTTQPSQPTEGPTGGGGVGDGVSPQPPTDTTAP